MLSKLCASAPLRVDFSGGYTDVEPFASQYSGRAVNMACTLSTSGCIEASQSQTSSVRIDTGTYAFVAPDELPDAGGISIVRSHLVKSRPTYPVNISVKSDGPRGSGLGSSASLSVVVGGLLNCSTGASELMPGLAMLAADVERAAGIDCGIQDHFSCAMGGLLSIEIMKGEPLVTSIKASASILDGLNSGVVLLTKSANRNSATIVRSVTSKLEEGDRHTLASLRAMNRLAQDMKQCLTLGDWKDFLKIIRAVYDAQALLHPLIVPPHHNEAVSRLTRDLKVAAKLTGGGGAGASVAIFCNVGESNEVIALGERMGFKALIVRPAWEGFRIARKE